MFLIRSYASFVVFWVIIAFFSSFVLSSITTNVTIRSTGQISTTTIWANSGSAEDIQAAVDAVAVAGGGTVYVPEGNFSFNPARMNYNDNLCGVVIPGGVSVIGAGKDKTILTAITYPADVMFYCDGSNGKPIRISGITFKGYVVDETSNSVKTAVNMYNCKNFRVDHCKFINFTGSGVSASVYTVAIKYENGEYQYYWNWGLVDHCEFDNSYKDAIGGEWGYGIVIHGPGRQDAWLYNLSDILGKWDIETNPIRCALYQWNETTQRYELVDPYGGKYFRWLVYIEDCTFSRTRHAIASNGGAFYVVRHCVFREPRPKSYPEIDVHGALSIKGCGGRGAEIYNNTIYAAKGYDYSMALAYRGGGGVVFKNTIIDCRYGVTLSADVQEQEVCLVRDLWVWNNTFTNVEFPVYDQYNLYEEGRDYFLQPKPNYTPYQYPHPLTR